MSGGRKPGDWERQRRLQGTAIDGGGFLTFSLTSR